MDWTHPASEAEVISTSTPQLSAAKPIAFQPGRGEARWFLGFLVTIKSSRATTNGTVSVIDNYGVRGLGSPLHVHHNEDGGFTSPKENLPSGSTAT